MTNEEVRQEVMKVLAIEPLNTHALRMALYNRLRDQHKLREAPYIEHVMRKLRENGLVYFGKDRMWHVGGVEKCAHCDGTGFVQKEAEHAQGDNQGEAQQEVETDAEVPAQDPPFENP